MCLRSKFSRWIGVEMINKLQLFFKISRSMMIELQPLYAQIHAPIHTCVYMYD